MATTTKSKKDAEREERLEKAHEMLVAKTAALTTSAGWREYLDFASRFHNYSLNNLLLILCQRPDASRVASYKKWGEMGRQVRKGEKSISIFAPMMRKVERENADGVKEEKRYVSGFRLVPVFDVAQTDGDPLPEDPAAPVLLTGEAPDGLWESLAAIVAEYGYTLRRGPSVRGENGFTSPSEKIVQVTEGLSDAQSVKTLAHEIGHMILHCKDDDLTADAVAHRGVAEVEAESIAHLVMAEHGVATDDYTLPYVAGWSDGKAEVVAATADRVLKTSREVLAKTRPEAEEVAAA